MKHPHLEAIDRDLLEKGYTSPTGWDMLPLSEDNDFARAYPNAIRFVQKDGYAHIVSTCLAPDATLGPPSYTVFMKIQSQSATLANITADQFPPDQAAQVVGHTVDAALRVAANYKYDVVAVVKPDALVDISATGEMRVTVTAADFKLRAIADRPTAPTPPTPDPVAETIKNVAYDSLMPTAAWRRYPDVSSERTVIKAYGGDRATNLESIADAIDDAIKNPEGAVFMAAKDAHKLEGYAEQLRIIAAELRGKKTQKSR